jgi:N-acetylglutamate synthase-like GNAT family acetyltransferase
MTTSEPQVRRATVEDLAQLRELWRQDGLPWQDFDKAFKDFQVVQTESGQILAALGLQIAGTEGWVFAEAFARPEQADWLRARLWERARIVAQNHGLVRIWTQFAALFWQQNGFSTASPDQLAKRPASFAGDEAPWFVLPLRDEAATGVNLDREFALFAESQKAERERLYRQARVAKVVAVIVATVLLVVFGMMVVRFLVVSRRPPPAPAPAQE